MVHTQLIVDRLDSLALYMELMDSVLWHGGGRNLVVLKLILFLSRPYHAYKGRRSHMFFILYRTGKLIRKERVHYTSFLQVCLFENIGKGL